jgi:hypothetical protein
VIHGDLVRHARRGCVSRLLRVRRPHHCGECEVPESLSVTLSGCTSEGPFTVTYDGSQWGPHDFQSANGCLMRFFIVCNSGSLLAQIQVSPDNVPPPFSCSQCETEATLSVTCEPFAASGTLDIVADEDCCDSGDEWTVNVTAA